MGWGDNSLNDRGRSRKRLAKWLVPAVAICLAQPSAQAAKTPVGQIAVKRAGGSGTEIWVMRPDGSDARQVSSTPDREFGTDPAISPDGKYLAYAAVGDVGSQIRILSLQNTDETLVTELPFESSEPAWSPDGTSLAFSSNLNGGIDVFTVEVELTSKGWNIGEPVNLTTELATDDGDPTWSPDGERIAFVSGHPTFRGIPSQGRGLILTMNSDGSDKQVLSATGGLQSAPDWSPDSKRIVFGQDSDIFVIGADGSGLSRLTDDPSGDALPTWSPDGRHIAFRSSRDGYAAIYVMRADGSGQTNITKFDNLSDDVPDWGSTAKR